MSRNIHASAVIEDGAVLGDDVVVGPFCHVGAAVELGAGVRLISNAVVAGNTRIGARTRIFPFASVGHEPQDLKYAGEKTTLVIGSDCTIREGVTINPGTAGDRGETTIGNKCVFLAHAHVAHDCVVGDGVIMSNNAMVAGHCKIGNHVILGGGAGVHQFCRIGAHAFIGGLAGVENDVIPFGAVLGNRAYLGGLNLIGMKRAGISRESIHAARKAFKDIFAASRPLQEAAAKLDADLMSDPVVAQIRDFILAGGERAFCTPIRNGREA